MTKNIDSTHVWTTLMQLICQLKSFAFFLNGKEKCEPSDFVLKKKNYGFGKI